MQNPFKSLSTRDVSSDRIKLFVALGLFVLVGLILAWQLLGNGAKQSVDPELEAQQQAIMEQVGASKEPLPDPSPPVAPEERGRGPRSVKGK
ncbi:MAG: hypothetical protein H7210_13845 [Pyrinomonadaceae bacterium]|nr:hypothetical protein [Phycisphaerales bacterium]